MRFVLLLFSTSVSAQSLAPVESSFAPSWPILIVAVLAAAGGGFLVGRHFGKNPTAETQAKAEVAMLFDRVHAALSALVDRIERHDPPATVVTTTAPQMTPEQIAAAQATIAHLQAQINQSS